MKFLSTIDKLQKNISTLNGQIEADFLIKNDYEDNLNKHVIIEKELIITKQKLNDVTHRLEKFEEKDINQKKRLSLQKVKLTVQFR